MSPDFNYAHIHIKAIEAAKRTGKVNMIKYLMKNCDYAF